MKTTNLHVGDTAIADYADALRIGPVQAMSLRFCIIKVEEVRSERRTRKTNTDAQLESWYGVGREIAVEWDCVFVPAPPSRTFESSTTHGRPAGEKEYPSPQHAPDEIRGLPGLRVWRQGDSNGDLPGIYFLCDGDEVVYVGQSRVVRNRVRSHIEARKQFDTVYYFNCIEPQLNKIERRHIDELRPKYNKAGVARADCPEVEMPACVAEESAHEAA